MARPCVAREFRRSGDSGLASMYPAFDWSVSLRAIMDISAPAALLADRPQRAIWVTSVRKRREDRTSISSQSLADLGMADVAGQRPHHGHASRRAPPSTRHYVSTWCQPASTVG